MPRKRLVEQLVLLVVVQSLSVTSQATSHEETMPLHPKFVNSEFIMGRKIPDVMHLNINTKDGLRDLIATWKNLDEKDDLVVSKVVPFTMIVPKIDFQCVENKRLKEFLMEHLVPGHLVNGISETSDHYGNSNGNQVILSKSENDHLMINGVKVIKTMKLGDKLVAIYVDGFLGDRRTMFSKRNIQDNNRYNEPQRLQMKNATKEESQPRKDIKNSPLMIFLLSMKSGTKVFQHFLSKSNISQILDDSPYTILIPSDNAFQRWHPIDWGFYPFSVQEFTENVLRNHLLQMKHPLRMVEVKEMDKEKRYKTLGGETVSFKNNPSPSVNNVSIIADYTLPNGNEVFIISEVLFVSETVVSRLHQMNKDKETPPLLAFPWFGAQFLSHSFLALERDSRFTQITRFLNTAEVAPYVSGANYTFFVPTDEAFEKYNFDMLSDSILSSDKGVKLLLHHFVKGRLYDRDLKHDEVFETIGGGAIKIQRLVDNNVSVNNARIVESEVFVYNLGTMFYIDDILYADILRDEIAAQETTHTPTTSEASVTATKSWKGDSNRFSTSGDVEIMSNEFSDTDGIDDDVLMQGDHDEEDDEDNDEIVTPRALPVRSPRK